MTGVEKKGGDESWSEKNLTTPSSPMPKDMIGAQKKLQITRRN